MLPCFAEHLLRDFGRLWWQLQGAGHGRQDPGPARMHGPGPDITQPSLRLGQPAFQPLSEMLTDEFWYAGRQSHFETVISHGPRHRILRFGDQARATRDDVPQLAVGLCYAPPHERCGAVREQGIGNQLFRFPPVLIMEAAEFDSAQQYNS